MTAEDAKKRAMLDVARGKAIKAERDAKAKLKVGDKVPYPGHVGGTGMTEGDRKVKTQLRDRPRIISVVAVEAELPYTGCICCGAVLNDDHSLRHRAACLYLAFSRTCDMADHYQARVEELEHAMREVSAVLADVRKRRPIRR